MDDLPDLITELTSGDDRRAVDAVERLSALGASALPAVKELFDCQDPDTRWWATWALAEIQDPQVPFLLKKALGDPDLGVRQAAALALRKHPDPEAIPDLIAILEGANPGVTIPCDPTLMHLTVAALIAAGEMAVPDLIRLLQNGSQPARVMAARALALIGDKRAIPALSAALDSDSAVLEYWAAEGLERMGVGMTFLRPG